jgi:hypothetical protein
VPGETGFVLDEHMRLRIKFDIMEMLIARTKVVKEAIMANQKCRLSDSLLFFVNLCFEQM